MIQLRENVVKRLISAYRATSFNVTRMTLAQIGKIHGVRFEEPSGRIFILDDNGCEREYLSKDED